MRLRSDPVPAYIQSAVPAMLAALCLGTVLILVGFAFGRFQQNVAVSLCGLLAVVLIAALAVQLLKQ
jgi:hypothetical protein